MAIFFADLLFTPRSSQSAPQMRGRPRNLNVEFKKLPQWQRLFYSILTLETDASVSDVENDAARWQALLTRKLKTSGRA